MRCCGRKRETSSKAGRCLFPQCAGIAARALPDLSTATLDELDKLFADMGALEKAVRSSIRDAFTASYMLPTLDMLKDGWAARYRTYIAVLKKAEFEQLWRERVRPAEQAQIERLRTAFKDTDISGMLGLISDMKGTSLESVSVCISLLSYPVAFSLCEGQFLDTVHEDDEEYLQSGFLSLIAHELMHGFASSELVEQYLTFMESNRYLRATHHALLTDMHSGDEEEFVMAAEYYILCRCGILTEEQIVQRNADRYNGCVPLSLYIFRHLVKEQPAAGYDGWLPGAVFGRNLPAAGGGFRHRRHTAGSVGPGPLFHKLFQCFAPLRLRHPQLSDRGGGHAPGKAGGTHGLPVYAQRRQRRPFRPGKAGAQHRRRRPFRSERMRKGRTGGRVP